MRDGMESQGMLLCYHRWGGVEREERLMGKEVVYLGPRDEKGMERQRSRVSSKVKPKRKLEGWYERGEVKKRGVGKGMGEQRGGEGWKNGTISGVFQEKEVGGGQVREGRFMMERDREELVVLYRFVWYF